MKKARNITKQELKSLITERLKRQSVQRDLMDNFKIEWKNLNIDYFTSYESFFFEIYLLKWSTEKQEAFCKTLAGPVYAGMLNSIYKNSYMKLGNVYYDNMR